MGVQQSVVRGTVDFGLAGKENVLPRFPSFVCLWQMGSFGDVRSVTTALYKGRRMTAQIFSSNVVR